MDNYRKISPPFFPYIYIHLCTYIVASRYSSPYLLDLEHRREAGGGRNTSGTRWNKAERVAKTGPKRSLPIRGDPRYRDRGLKSGADTKRGVSRVFYRCAVCKWVWRRVWKSWRSGVDRVTRARGTSGKLSHLRVVRTPSPACSTTRREVSSRRNDRIGRKSKRWEMGIFERIGPTFFSFRTKFCLQLLDVQVSASSFIISRCVVEICFKKKITL